MRILSRYILKAHVGPFVFALSVLTGVLFVNTVARRLPELAGKGLPASVFGKVLLYSLPHIVALTLPMAVLVAVLYAYSSLAADNEVTALKASGVNMLRLLVPVLIAATVLAGGMVWFNDRVLPETNHELKTLLMNIGAKLPTLQMQEQTVNAISGTEQGSRLFIKPGQVDHTSGNMKNVVIYDLSDSQYRRTIYADSGRLVFNQDTTDLFLTLHDGYLLEVGAREPAGLSRVNFARQVSVIRGVGNSLDLSARDEYRSDRELSLAMLSERIDSTRSELRATRRELYRQADTAVARVLRGARYGLPYDDQGRLVSTSTGAGGLPSPYFAAAPSGDELLDVTASEVRALTNRGEDLQRRINQFRVEYHKKYAIPFACIIFVLIGAPLGVRFPRGGVGMVIAISVTIFGIYYMSLIGGETLGDDGRISPLLGPWGPNFIFGLIALWALTRIGKETSTSRGGDWEDLLRTVASVASRPFRGRARARAGGLGSAAVVGGTDAVRGADAVGGRD